VREVARSNIVALEADATRADLTQRLRADGASHGQRLYPVVNGDRRLVGVVTRDEVRAWADESVDGARARLADITHAEPVVAYPEEPLRVVVFRMAETGLTRFPVVEPGPERRLVGMVSLDDLLKARQLNLEAERRRERVLPLRLVFPRRRTPPPPPPANGAPVPVDQAEPVR